MADEWTDEAGATENPPPTEGPAEAVPMVGEYRIDYSPLSREEIEATCPETESLLARSILIGESPEI